VSLAAASLALSGKGRISAEVRARVRAAAAELSYRTGPGRPGTAGRAAVGILHAEDRAYEWNFVRPTLLELERGIHQGGCSPVLLPLPSRASAEEAVSLVLDAGVAAVFAIQYANADAFARMSERGLRLVVINNSGFQDKFHSVCVDDFQGAYEGARSLLALGHRTIAFVEYERPELPSLVADRFVGFRKALEERRAPFAADQRITIPFMDEGKLEQKLAALFSRRSGAPTAVFAHDDYLGLYVIKALRRLGLAVPADVSLVAPGDVLDYSLPVMPQITTMRIDTALLGRTAANLMLDRLHSEAKDVHVLKVKEQLVNRGSCRRLEGGPSGAPGGNAPGAPGGNAPGAPGGKG
jgi:DNA-binding LacI/PurR family transcriptional regulator